LTSRSTKLKIFLIADLILLAAIIPAYLYVDSQILEPATFEVRDLVINPTWVQVGGSVDVSATVTNVGDQDGNESVALSIDDTPVTAKTLHLSGGESTSVVFSATDLTEGNHTIAIGDATGSVNVTLEKPSQAAELKLTDLATSRKEAGVGDPIIVSVVATNVGDLTGEFILELIVNNEQQGNKVIYLDGGESTTAQFEITENAEGTYEVSLGDLTTSFSIISDAQPIKPAEFQVSQLTVSPQSVLDGEPLEISAKITNVGEETGTYSAELMIDGSLRDTSSVELSGGATTIVTFEIVETNSGEHTVAIDDQSGSFSVESLGDASPAILLDRMTVRPYEVWYNETVYVRSNATNYANEDGTLMVRLSIEKDDVILYSETKSFSISAGAVDFPVEFSFVAEVAGGNPSEITTEGYSIDLENLGNKTNIRHGYFRIAHMGYHTLSIIRAGGGTTPMIFTLNGVQEETPFREFLPVGIYSIATDEVVDLGTGVVEFYHWNDGTETPSMTFEFNEYTQLIAQYIIISGYASCPSLYVWNGTDYLYITEVSNAGWLGYIDYINETGDIVFGGGNPWDHVKIDTSQFQPVTDTENGSEYYDCVLYQQWDEIFYTDTAYLVVVDHPNDTDAYATMINYLNKGLYDEIYTVDEDNLLPPVSATNEKGENVLPQIAQLDGNFTEGSNGVLSPSWDNITYNKLTLDLGDLSDAPEVKLVINGMVDWGEAQPYYDWIDQFEDAVAQGLIKNNTQINPPAYMEVMDAQGNWIRVPQDRQMPIPGDYVSRSFAVDLSDLFPEGVADYKIRITNFWNVTFDYIGIDVSPQQNITVTNILPIATLEPTEFATTNSTASGNFTRYGDITYLLSEADDKFVIGMQGDTMHLKFPTTDLPELEDGMERSFFMFVASWFKDPEGNWGFGFDFTVEPLPFQGMTGFPYPGTEHHPDDGFLSEWNTRIVNSP
jgi:hypothetical protein